MGVGVVEAQVAHASVGGRDAEVQANGLGVADVQVAVGFGREAGLYPAVVLALLQVVLYYLFDEVQALLFACRLFGFHFCHNAVLYVFWHKSTTIFLEIVTSPVYIRFF